MDNIRDENLRRLGRFIAEELIRLAGDTQDEDWIETDIRDHMIGELARCLTLQNLYLDREEYEKCAIMKLRIQDIKDSLKLENDLDVNLNENDEE
jgi:hypothetical protein